MIFAWGSEKWDEQPVMTVMTCIIIRFKHLDTRQNVHFPAMVLRYKRDCLVNCLTKVLCIHIYNSWVDVDICWPTYFQLGDTSRSSGFVMFVFLLRRIIVLREQHEGFTDERTFTETNGSDLPRTWHRLHLPDPRAKWCVPWGCNSQGLKRCVANPAS